MAASASGRWGMGSSTAAAPRPATPGLEQGIRKALALGQFELHYQPRICVHSRRIVSVEALLRWRHPLAGLVSPAAFLPMLETNGLIHEVGEWAFERAARDCDHWQRLGLPPVRASVNISRAQIQRGDFAQSFLRHSRLWASSVFNLDVEVTESTLLHDSDATVKKLHVLRSAGIQISVDDFGSGHSALARLADLPIDALKIDPLFVRRLPHDRAARTLVSTIVSLAHGLGLTVTAEGVEKREQLELLRQYGCDHSQGFLHSKPVTRDEMGALLREGKGWVMLPIDVGQGLPPWRDTVTGQMNAL
jgi:EAL domain-containing protein (putative c-di-GMP-specific phosphodiesterase class I)